MYGLGHFELQQKRTHHAALLARWVQLSPKPTYLCWDSNPKLPLVGKHRDQPNVVLLLGNIVVDVIGGTAVFQGEEGGGSCRITNIQSGFLASSYYVVGERYDKSLLFVR